MPELQDPPVEQNFYYRGTQNDGLDRMFWPHALYTFFRVPYVSEQDDNTRLVASAGSGSRSFANFKRALSHLINGEIDWDKAQNRSIDPKIVVRIVKAKPFFADVRQVDKRQVAVAVQGVSMLNTVVQLDAPGDIFVEKASPHPDSYLIDVEKDMPQQGQLTLIQGG